MARHALLATVLYMAVCACGEPPAAPAQQAPPAPPLARPSSADPEAEAARGKSQGQPLPQQHAVDRDLPAPSTFDPDKALREAQERAAQQQKDQQQKERDLGYELGTAVGSVSACLAPRTADQVAGQIPVTLIATVTDLGIVTRGEVSAPGLMPAEIDCIRKRLGAVRLRSPIENAPRTIRASITLRMGPGNP